MIPELSKDVILIDIIKQRSKAVHVVFPDSFARLCKKWKWKYRYSLWSEIKKYKVFGKVMDKVIIF